MNPPWIFIFLGATEKSALPSETPRDHIPHSAPTGGAQHYHCGSCGLAGSTETHHHPGWDRGCSGSSGRSGGPGHSAGDAATSRHEQPTEHATERCTKCSKRRYLFRPSPAFEYRYEWPVNCVSSFSCICKTRYVYSCILKNRVYACIFSGK